MYYNNTPIDETTLTKDVEVVNQTRRYLIPQFKHYGLDIIRKIKSLAIKGVFIQDYGINISEESRKIKPEIYFLFDVNGFTKFGHYINVKQSRMEFMEALQYFRNLDYYVIDYPFDSNKNGNLHVVVLKIPFPETLDLFLQGQYSKMYTKDQIKNWVPETIEINGHVEKTSIYQVLTKDPKYFDTFRNKVIDELGVRESSINYKSEYDLPPYYPNEILRYN